MFNHVIFQCVAVTVLSNLQ